MRRTMLTAALGLATLGLAACGSDDGEPDGQPRTTPTSVDESTTPPSASSTAPEQGPGDPEVRMTINGRPAGLKQDEIECLRGSRTVTFANANPHGTEAGLVMNIDMDQLAVTSLVFSSDDVLLGPFDNDTGFLTVTASGDDAWEVRGTTRNRFGDHERIRVRIVASCTT